MNRVTWLIVLFILLVLYISGFLIYYRPKFEKCIGTESYCYKKYKVIVPALNGEFSRKPESIIEPRSNPVMAVVYYPFVKWYSNKYVMVLLDL
jgi:hypothetical protein